MNRENGAICAVRDIELSPDEPNSAERLRQLEQVGPLLIIPSYLVLQANRLRCLMRMKNMIE